ncbi:ribonuclease M5 [Clostridia bacterium]|nr:ribonuclease M5 [Clostridia bacterium]
MRFKTKFVIIVEGKYDKIKLSEIVESPMILETGGFGIFKNKELQRLIRKLSVNPGVIVFTDSDDAGKIIRNFIKNITKTVKQSTVKNAYLPQIIGKERRKNAPSKSGLLGVEGYTKEEIIQALRNICMNEISECEESQTFISREMMYNDGLIGGIGSASKRKVVLKALNMPENLTVSQIIEVINAQKLHDIYIQTVKLL